MGRRWYSEMVPPAALGRAGYCQMKKGQILLMKSHYSLLPLTLERGGALLFFFSHFSSVTHSVFKDLCVWSHQDLHICLVRNRSISSPFHGAATRCLCSSLSSSALL